MNWLKNSLSGIAMALLLLVSTSSISLAQTLKNGKFYLNEDGSHFVKLTLLTQVWARSLSYNPGSTVFGYAKDKGVDFGIRRYRVQFMGQLTDRVFVYSQFGENNFNAISDRKVGFFVHDALGEYALVKNKLSLGMGLTAWSGLSRFSAPSVGAILGVDAPLFLQSTNDVTDQFLRKLSVYAKGKLGKLDYRLTVADPMAIQKTTLPITPSVNSTFSPKPPKKQWNGYLMYQFLDQESNQTPYMVGTYLGKKKVFNIGAGFVYQPDAMWHLPSATATADQAVMSNMLQLAADVFYDAPTNKNGEAISLYGNVTHFDFGPNYTRNLGAMNPANGTTNTAIMNGGGNGYPAFGTGNAVYAQAGYKLKDNLIGKTTLMPYASIHHANYDRLQSGMNYYEAGVNFLLDGQTSKFTLGYQNRPIFSTDGVQTDRKGALIAQYQVYFN